MSEFKKIGIIGLGLIGGSLAKKLHEKNMSILGFTRNKNSCLDAQFEVTENLENLKSCDLVFVCGPLSEILNTLQKIKNYLRPNCLVTDVGSVKTFICEQAPKILGEKINFIGGHPMAGTEKQGFENSFPELFQNRPWVLTQENQKLKNLLEKTGSRVIYADPEEHDQAVAFISHLPLLLSISLKETINKINNPRIKFLAESLKSSGFESMTRLANGNEILNRDLLSLNKYNINKSLCLFEELIQETRNLY